MNYSSYSLINHTEIKNTEKRFSEKLPLSLGSLQATSSGFHQHCETVPGHFFLSNEIILGIKVPKDLIRAGFPDIPFVIIK